MRRFPGHSRPFLLNLPYFPYYARHQFPTWMWKSGKRNPISKRRRMLLDGDGRSGPGGIGLDAILPADIRRQRGENRTSSAWQVEVISNSTGSPGGNEPHPRRASRPRIPEAGKGRRGRSPNLGERLFSRMVRSQRCLGQRLRWNPKFADTGAGDGYGIQLSTKFRFRKEPPTCPTDSGNTNYNFERSLGVCAHPGWRLEGQTHSSAMDDE